MTGGAIATRRRRRGSSIAGVEARSGAGRVWNVICLVGLVLLGTAVLFLFEESLRRSVLFVVDGVAHLLGVREPSAGERMGWWGFPIAFLIVAVGFEILWVVSSWLFWRPKAGDRRHPALRWSTWVGILLFTVTIGAPAFIEAAMMADSPKPTYPDRREGMLSISRDCPALAKDVQAAIARGVPTSQEVVSMRMRAKVIARSPLPGQECRA